MKHILFALFVMGASTLSAHCQVPCGIYHDQMIVEGMKEDIQTLHKAVKEIGGNPGSSAQDKNQLVRWVMNKEKHADKLSDTMVEYFLKQRIKPEGEQLNDKLKAAHQVIFLTMKVKQSVDPSMVQNLEQALQRFVLLMYPEQAHSHSHHH